MSDFRLTVATGLALSLLATGEAYAQSAGSLIEIGQGVMLDPILDARLRHESVGQGGIARDAEASTLRARVGAEIKADGFSILAEGEGTLALSGRYNDTLPGNGVEPFPVVADPENIELNRFQVSYVGRGFGVTVGRQRIVLDNARFVGNVGWRQNEQTFDAVRGQGKAGRFSFDATYATSQRTVFGSDSPNSHFDGDFVFLGAGADLSAIEVKTFAYLLDYEGRVGFSSQTYGLQLAADIPVPAVGKLAVRASYARQGDYGANPVRYDADYYAAQLGVDLAGFALAAGYEELGSDHGVAAFQTPLATLHAFNGWADMFLTTPATGLRDRYLGVGRAIPVSFLPGLRFDAAWHRFDSDFGGIRYGDEWDVSLGWRMGPVSLLAKYADYDARDFGADTRKFWLQAEAAF